ncbi:TPA: hypothetical protein NPO59_001669 [Klebsiella pneumoniae]|uniref:hypothetical protein n=1 Tax=Klebsiella pneumoniae TaxID=573 RepID=UPI00190EEB99|nr:hypothetical protein [Klebsiella pneumoniae]MBK4960746.1 hypothetical protein [Klebsiella pneumoniae]HBY4557690.1 hypothetical protein [Klebsiella pneumoniae]HCI6253791.1 hypothetical protein [Klebsiella pneumoniae]HCI6583479.1 hypothetical protein [Klebsiella pneumoniae]
MTDITELAQREKFEAWFKSSFHPDKTGPYIKDQLYFAWKAAGAELVQALEKAQAQSSKWLEAYHKAVSIGARYEERIAELEESHAQVIQSRDHYKRISEEGLKQLAESRTVTVKLPKPHAHLIWIQAGHAPDDYWDDVAVSHSEKDRCCDGSERYPVYARWEIEEMLAAAGIKVEAE